MNDTQYFLRCLLWAIVTVSLAIVMYHFFELIFLPC